MIFSLKDKIQSDTPALACWNMIADPQMASVLARLPFDAVCFDAQHGFHTEASLKESIPHVLLAGKAPMVRIPPNRWDMAERFLDFGGVGVVAPMINNAEDASELVQATKYLPFGERSFGPRYASEIHNLTASEYLEVANDATLALAQVETKQAYENLDEILSVEGLDGILIGPSDFSIYMRGNRQQDPYGEETLDAVKDTVLRAKEAGKIAGAFGLGEAQNNLLLELGCDLISVALDLRIVADGVQKVFDELNLPK